VEEGAQRGCVVPVWVFKTLLGKVLRSLRVDLTLLSAGGWTRNLPKSLPNQSILWSYLNAYEGQANWFPKTVLLQKTPIITPSRQADLLSLHKLTSKHRIIEDKTNRRAPIPTCPNMYVTRRATPKEAMQKAK